MTQAEAEEKIRKRFWKYHDKLVVESDSKEFFDAVVLDAQDHGVLWEVLEFAEHHLSFTVDKKGSEILLEIRDYLEALEYGYSEWVK